MNSLVMYRGNDGQDIYLNDADRNLLLETISEMSERFEVDIFAYFLLSNHYHLLVKTRHANLKKAINGSVPPNISHHDLPQQKRLAKDIDIDDVLKKGKKNNLINLIHFARFDHKSYRLCLCSTLTTRFSER